MKILILGASGFIGNSLFHALITKHTIFIGGRKPVDGFPNYRLVDFSTENNWDEVLRDIDLVINAIGIIEGNFELIQTKAPIGLYKSCISKRLKIIHISALGAEKEVPLTYFLKSKKITDDFLIEKGNAKIIYPGIVIGKNGKSSQFFKEIAQFPILPIFSTKPILWIHIAQLCKLIEDVILNFDSKPKQIFAISEPESLGDILRAIKGKEMRFIKIPPFVFKALFCIFPYAKIGVFSKETFAMFEDMEADNYSTKIPKASSFINPNDLKASEEIPSLIALISLSFIWIWSGLISLISWEESMKLTLDITSNIFIASIFIYLGSFVDIVLGLLLFPIKYRKKTLLLQMFTMFSYMLILSIFAGHHWTHPFGVLSKNIPIIALSFYLYKKA